MAVHFAQAARAALRGHTNASPLFFLPRVTWVEDVSRRERCRTHSKMLKRFSLVAFRGREI
jgi:hypothetical protein